MPDIKKLLSHVLCLGIQVMYCCVLRHRRIIGPTFKQFKKDGDPQQYCRILQEGVFKMKRLLIVFSVIDILFPLFLQLPSAHSGPPIFLPLAQEPPAPEKKRPECARTAKKALTAFSTPVRGLSEKSGPACAVCRPLQNTFSGPSERTLRGVTIPFPCLADFCSAT